MSDLKEFYEIGDLMAYATGHGLETEVVWSALKAMKENNTLSVVEAMRVGLEEFDL